MTRRSVAGFLAAAAVAISVICVAPPALGHTEVQRATPGPGEVVTAPVDEIRLQFLDPVLPRVRIAVRTTEGALVPGLGVVEHADDGRSATVDFDPLDAAGAYVVEYEFVALDGDAQSDGYRFTIVPATADGGRSILGPVALGVASLALGGAFVVALRRRSVVNEVS